MKTHRQASLLLVLILLWGPLTAQISTEQLAASPDKLFQYASGLYRRELNEMALDALDSGKALKKLQQIQEASNVA